MAAVTRTLPPLHQLRFQTNTKLTLLVFTSTILNVGHEAPSRSRYRREKRSQSHVVDKVGSLQLQNGVLRPHPPHPGDGKEDAKGSILTCRGCRRHSVTQGARSREVVYVPWQTSLVKPTFERSCKVTVGALRME